MDFSIESYLKLCTTSGRSTASTIARRCCRPDCGGTFNEVANAYACHSARASVRVAVPMERVGNARAAELQRFEITIKNRKVEPARKLIGQARPHGFRKPVVLPPGRAKPLT